MLSKSTIKKCVLFGGLAGLLIGMVGEYCNIPTDVYMLVAFLIGLLMGFCIEGVAQ